MSGLRVLTLSFGVAVACIGTAHATDPPARQITGATVRAVADDQSSLSIKDGDTVVTIAAGKEFKKRLEDLRRGDRVTVTVSDEPKRDTRKEAQVVLKELVAAEIITVSLSGRGLALGAALATLLIIGAGVLGVDLPRLIVGKDGRYSTSKTQMAMWFAVLIVTYVAVIGIRAWSGGLGLLGGVNLPQNLLLLSGVSALTFAAAKGITVKNLEHIRRDAKDDAIARNAAPEPAAAAAEAKAKPMAGAAGSAKRGLTNLVTDDDGDPDIGDFQMTVVTVLAVVVYLAQTFAFLGAMEKLSIVTIPDVDTTVLAAFGLGQAAYLTKKYAGKNGA